METTKQAAKKFLQINNAVTSTGHCLVEGAFIAGVEFAQHWISVEDELPKARENMFYSNTVLVKFSDGKVGLSACNPLQKDWLGVHAIYPVTHWRHIEL
jgi:hypothetical protein